MRLTVLATVAMSMAITAGCGSTDEPEAAPAAATSAPELTSQAASRMPDAGPQSSTAARRPVREPPLNPAAARNVQPFDRTGVAACDNLSDVVLRCINVHTVGRERMNLRREYDDAVDGWREQLDSGASSTEVAQRCTSFRDSFRAELQAAGCSGV